MHGSVSDKNLMGVNAIKPIGNAGRKARPMTAKVNKKALY